MNISFAPRSTSLLGRITFLLIAAVIAVLGFFFFASALVAGSILAAVIGARLWWRMRKLKKQASAQANANVVEGEYQVIEHSETRTALPPRSDKS
jgi:predicted lipid-binding transport protein (Tim44 family)